MQYVPIMTPNPMVAPNRAKKSSLVRYYDDDNVRYDDDDVRDDDEDVRDDDDRNDDDDYDNDYVRDDDNVNYDHDKDKDDKVMIIIMLIWRIMMLYFKRSYIITIILVRARSHRIPISLKYEFAYDITCKDDDD